MDFQRLTNIQRMTRPSIQQTERLNLPQYGSIDSSLRELPSPRAAHQRLSPENDLFRDGNFMQP
jgi:hypothetical protein